MRNIFLFLRRFSTFFTFLFLQIICLSIVFRFNKFHNAIGLTFANNFTGKIHKQQAKVNGFFTLRQTADSLAKRNAEILNAKPNNLLRLDTGIKEIADFIPIDTLGNVKKIVHFVYRPAQVLYNTTNGDKMNYMFLARGKNEGLDKDMAVLGAESNAVIGKVIYADAKFSYVMTLLHKQSIIPAKLARSGDNGTITWDGKNNRIVNLNKIPRTSDIKIGDTIQTSNNSDIFPENLLIGTIQSFAEDKANGNYIIKVKTAANFNSINYVNVVENTQQKELRAGFKIAEKTIQNK
jgi:rod shape-determining protein MreC